MFEHKQSVADGHTTEGLPVAPALGPALEEARVPPERALVDARVVFICALSVAIALAAGFVAQLLMRLIALVTNLSFFGRLSIAPASPADNHLGGWVVLVPVAGALIVGLMARYGSAAIRGHGIPEAMEQVLLNKSRIPARITLLKPISAAISIGTGGPSAPRGRSSPPAAPWARSSASCSTPPRPSARRCSPPAPRRG
jgi:H+/Cl- antiporter ClcA